MSVSYIVRADLTAIPVQDTATHKHKWHSFTLTGHEKWDRCPCGNYRTAKPIPVKETK